MQFALVYIPCPSKEEAKTIGRTLVEERLAGCINVLDKMESLYFWEGEIQEGSEAVLIAKTQESLVPDLTSRVEALHSYTCPCIISLPLQSVNPAYAQWLQSVTKE